MEPLLPGANQVDCLEVPAEGLDDFQRLRDKPLTLPNRVAFCEHMQAKWWPDFHRG